MENRYYPFRSFVLFSALVAGIGSSQANVTGYSFASASGIFTSISGTTLFSGTWDDVSSSLLTIPFTFTYNNVAYTTVGVNSNGFITMGAVPGTTYCGLQTSATNSIAGYGTDLVGSATSTVQYTTTGSTPNRKFIVQWNDCDHFGNSLQNHWTFQIILNETSNTVQVVWGGSTDATTMGANTCADVATESGNVGLLGSSTADFNIRSVSNINNTWSTSAAGGSISAVCNMSSTNIPSSGLTWTWTPPVPAPMVYGSSTTTLINNAQVDPRSSLGNVILQVDVVTTGNLSPFNITALALSTSGCTNAGTDLLNAKVYSTGASNAFATTTQYGSTASNPNGSYTVNGSATLLEGNNYFWISYDIKPAAGVGNVLTGCCTQITGSGTMGAQVPTIGCPNGAHTVGEQLGTWTALASSAPDPDGGVMLLLSDGTVMVKTTSGGGDGVGNVWDKLTPNATGSYVNGTWSTLAPMTNTRLYFSTQVLKDGRVYVAGGEYGTGGTAGEVYDPVANTWTLTPSPPNTVSDANSEILPDGRVIQALVAGSLTGTAIYNPVTNTYSTGPSCLGIHNESAWVKLPDNSILFVDRLTTNSERYIPATNTWIVDGTVPVALYDPFGDETGSAFLLPDGRAWFIGSPGHTAYYTPTGTTSPGTWAAGPDVPNAQGAPDAAGAMMVNGKILCAVSPVPTSANHFPSPTSFYEFNYLTNSFSQVGAPGGGSSSGISAYVTNMVDLPDGNVLYSIQGSSQYYVYTPAGAALTSGKPAISSVAQNACSVYTVIGTQFNGISEGAGYGDDWQMASNYPIVRLTSGANVYYARSFNWNSTGVRRGVLADTAKFTLPAGLPAGTYSLVVVANGIASDPVSFTPSATITPTISIAITSGTNPTTPGASITFTATIFGGGVPSYQWKVNGANSGGNSATYTTTTLTNGQIVTCVLTSSLACASPTTATSAGITISVIGAKVSPKVFLDGPFDGASLMNDALRSLPGFPLTEPFTAAGFTQVGGGGETISASVLNVSGNNAIVDWVLIELRDKNNSSSILRTKAALLQRDGDVVDLDGISVPGLPVIADNYFVAIRHTNHFGVMTLSSVALSTTTTALDFTNGTVATYGTNAQKIVGSARVLWAGNVQRDITIKYTGASNDRDPILVRIGGVIPTNTVTGYFPEDVNRDGVVKYTGAGNDRDPILVNIGGSVPTNTISEQLP